MNLHARKCIFHPLPPQYWRGLEPVMQLHEMRYMKRAGEAGIALRAGCSEGFKFICILKAKVISQRHGVVSIRA
ncbi:TPA: hypothetical protein JD344_14830 [Serratia marcescens]|nr:hypothetical protein [Serratia marcescens]HAU5739857.1 hypothetical protein [Serratia marcescens]HAU5747277.1 hypothetical protein [Serratia marcescens]HAU5755874.1 hypothetical protein [Serratia marcescens]HAU5765882.1 hypothetical protein [Serratia marcescens]